MISQKQKTCSNGGRVLQHWHPSSTTTKTGIAIMCVWAAQRVNLDLGGKRCTEKRTAPYFEISKLREAR